MFGGNFLLFMLVFFLVWLLIRSLFLIRKKQVIKWTNELILHVFVFYLIAVVYVTMQPFNFQIPFVGSRDFMMDLQLFYQVSHMAEGHYYLKSLYVFGNILLLFPFGLLAPFIFKKMTHFIRLMIASFLVSLSIELIQGLFTLTRRATLDDLVLNTAGAILGYLVYLWVKRFNGGLKN